MQAPVNYQPYSPVPSAVPAFSAPYVVMFEFTQPIEKYAPFMAELKAHGKWLSYTAGSYVVVRNDTLVDFSGKLRRLMFTTDRLLVLPARGPADGWLPQEAWNWLNQELPKLW